MKKLILILLLIPSLCFGNDAALIMGKAPAAISTICGKAIAGVSSFAGAGVAAPSCVDVAQQEVAASNGSTNITQTTSTDWMAAKFAVGEAGYTVCKVGLYLEKDGTLEAGTITFYFYSHDGVEDDPNASVCTIGTINMADVPDSESEVVITGASCALSASTTYWLVSSASTATGATNLIKWHYTTTATTKRTMYDDDGSGTWSELATTNSFKYKIYK